MSIILQQNAHLVKSGGFEKEGLSLFPDTKVSMSLPLIHGKIVHGLKEEEIAVVEKHFGFTFDSPEGVDFYAEQIFTLPRILRIIHKIFFVTGWDGILDLSLILKMRLKVQ